MKNTGAIVLIIVIVVAAIAVMLFYFGNFGQEKKFDWTTTFKHDKAEPYDFSILQELLKANYDFERVDKDVASTLPVNNANGKAYIYIGNYPYHSEKTAKSILDFAENGGEVVLLTESYTDSLLHFIQIFLERDIDLNMDINLSKQIKVDYFNQNNSKTYPFAFKVSVKDTAEFHWSYFKNSYSEASDTTYPLLPAFTLYSSFSNPKTPQAKYINFIGLNVGKGKIYWHCNPLLFTNLYLSKNNTSGFENLNAFLSHFKTKKWYWDHVSVYPTAIKPPTKRDRAEKPKSVMEYVFSQPALKFGWLILVAMAVLYGLFGAKRRQQHIPIIESNRNTSLEFVNTIGLLYFQQQNHKVIFEKIMQLFRAHLRRRYGLILKDEDLKDEDKIRLTVKRTDVNEVIIRNIFDNYLDLKSKLGKREVEMSAETLNKFYQLVNDFYNAEIARKISAKSAQTTL